MDFSWSNLQIFFHDGLCVWHRRNNSFCRIFFVKELASLFWFVLDLIASFPMFVSQSSCVRFLMLMKRGKSLKWTYNITKFPIFIQHRLTCILQSLLVLCTTFFLFRILLVFFNLYTGLQLWISGKCLEIRFLLIKVS